MDLCSFFVGCACLGLVVGVPFMILAALGVKGKKK